MTNATKKRAKHTPGPWNIEEADERLYVQGSDIQTARDMTARDIAMIYRPGRRGTANADARLIAAAPELLEAAEAVLRLFWDHVQYNEPDDPETVSLESLRAAIAKAKGDTT